MRARVLTLAAAVVVSVPAIAPGAQAAGWSAWRGIPGAAGADADADARGVGRLDVLWAGVDGDLHHTWFDASLGGWATGPRDLGHPAATGWIFHAAGVWDRSSRLNAVARGSDRQLWLRQWEGSWGDWRPAGLGFEFDYGPDITSWAPGRADVFVISDGALYHEWTDTGFDVYSGFRWIGAPAGVRLTGAPAAVSWGVGRLDVFARGENGAVYHKYWQGGWGPWKVVPTLTEGIDEVEASTWGTGRLDVFTRHNGTLFHTYFGGQGWSGVSTPIDRGLETYGMAAASWSAGRHDLVGHPFSDVSSSTQLYHRCWC